MWFISDSFLDFQNLHRDDRLGGVFGLLKGVNRSKNGYREIASQIVGLDTKLVLIPFP